MAQELNFDELDHAVNQYMQRKGDRPTGNSFGQPPTATTPSNHVQPASQNQAPTPVSMPPKRPDVTPDAHRTDTLPQSSLHDAAHAEERPAMRIAPRRAIAPRPGGRSTTFHDIAPPRRAPAFTTAHLQPTSPGLSRPVASRPAATLQPSQSAGRPVSQFSDVAPLRPSPTVKPETEENVAEKIVPKQPFSEESVEEAPAKVLGSSEEVSKPQEAPESSQVASTMAQEPAALPPQETVPEAEPTHEEDMPQEDTFGTSPDLPASEPKTTEEPSSGAGTFDAETTQAFTSQEPTAAPEANEATPQKDEVSAGNAFQPQDLASLDKITARPVQPDLSLADESTGRLKAEKKAEWPSTAGLLDTGELHTPAMLPGDEKGMNHGNKATVGQVFDTKPYHGPIQGGHSGTSPARVAIIVTLIVMFVLIAAVAVFMYVS